MPPTHLFYHILATSYIEDYTDNTIPATPNKDRTSVIVLFDRFVTCAKNGSI